MWNEMKVDSVVEASRAVRETPLSAAINYALDPTAHIEWNEMKENKMKVFEVIVVDNADKKGKPNMKIVKEFDREVAESPAILLRRIIARMGDGWKDTYEVQVRPF